MSEIKLTPRLSTLAEMIPFGARLADIGTDHALLPLALLRNGQISSAIASDMRKGPLDSARRNAEAFGFAHRLSLRLGSGLSCIASTECDAISIAGMGGETIAQILQDAGWPAEGKHTLLLQPMTMLPELRQFLWEHGYCIHTERICAEGRRWYIILCVQGGGSIPSHPPRLANCHVSPALLKDPAAHAYLRTLLHRETRTLVGMQQGQAPDPAKIVEQECTIQKIQTALEELK